MIKVSVSIDNDKIRNIVERLKRTQNTFDDMSKRLSEMIARAFVARARKRLLAFTGQKRYSYYIKPMKLEDGYWAVVLNKPKYDPYIMYFLEYGTGFVGRDSEQNPNKPADWEYTINQDKFWYAKLEIDGQFKEGWYFNKRPFSFIQEEDVNLDEEYHFVKVIQKNSDDGPRNPSPEPTYFTSGIKPVMYIYKTTVEINNLLQQVKGKKLKISYKKLKSRLNKLISSEI